MGRAALRIGAGQGLAIAGLAAPVMAGAEPDVFSAMGVLRPAAPSLAPDPAFLSLEGRRVRLSDLRGRPILLGFFTMW